MEYLIGQTLGRYQINKLLGKGGMGAVFKARDLELDRDVAIKLMNPEYAHRTDFSERFRQEAKAAARMDHPGIVKVFDFGEAQNHPFLVMEFIPGVNLRYMIQQLSKEQRWITLAESVQIVRETAYALAYAHEMKVLHRDIKPANIMLKDQSVRGSVAEPEVRPVITDLGLAKLQDAGLQTMVGMSAGGTPAYMSPEQAQGLPVDARSDVYSLGVLLFELAMGERPYPIRSSPDAVRYHVHEPLPQPSMIRPDVDPVLETILLTALAKQPEDRYHSAAMLGDALQGIRLDSLPTTVPPNALHGSADLFTLHRQHLLHSPSPMTPTPQRQSGSIVGDQVRVMRPDGSTYALAFTGGRMRIGRGPDNEIVLDDNRISRLHALVERAGNNFRIVDQGSANGLMLGQKKLLTNQSAAWMPDQAVRIGSHVLFLQQADASQSQMAGAVAEAPARSAPHDIYRGDKANTLVDLPVPPMARDAARQAPKQAPRQATRKLENEDRRGIKIENRSRLQLFGGLLLFLLLVGGGYAIGRFGLGDGKAPIGPSVAENATPTVLPVVTKTPLIDNDLESDIIATSDLDEDDPTETPIPPVDRTTLSSVEPPLRQIDISMDEAQAGQNAVLAGALLGQATLTENQFSSLMTFLMRANFEQCDGFIIDEIKAWFEPNVLIMELSLKQKSEYGSLIRAQFDSVENSGLKELRYVKSSSEQFPLTEKELWSVLDPLATIKTYSCERSPSDSYFLELRPEELTSSLSNDTIIRALGSMVTILTVFNVFHLDNGTATTSLEYWTPYFSESAYATHEKFGLFVQRFADLNNVDMTYEELYSRLPIAMENTFFNTGDSEQPETQETPIITTDNDLTAVPGATATLIQIPTTTLTPTFTPRPTVDIAGTPQAEVSRVPIANQAGAASIAATQTAAAQPPTPVPPTDIPVPAQNSPGNGDGPAGSQVPLALTLPALNANELTLDEPVDGFTLKRGTRFSWTLTYAGDAVNKLVNAPGSPYYYEAVVDNNGFKGLATPVKDLFVRSVSATVLQGERYHNLQPGVEYEWTVILICQGDPCREGYEQIGRLAPLRKFVFQPSSDSDDAEGR